MVMRMISLLALDDVLGILDTFMVSPAVSCPSLLKNVALLRLYARAVAVYLWTQEDSCVTLKM